MLQPWSLHKLDFLIIPSLIHVPLVIGMVLVLIMFLAIKYSDQILALNVALVGLGNLKAHLTLTKFENSLPLHPSVQRQCRVSILPYTFKSSCNWLMDIKGRIYGQPIPPFRLSSFRHLQVGLRSFEDRPHLSSAGRTLRVFQTSLLRFEFPQVELHKPRQMHRTLLSLDSSVLGEECIIQRIGQIYGCEDYWFISISLYYAVIRTGQAVSLIRLTSIIFEVFYQHLSRLSLLLISERPLRLKSSPDCQRNRSSLTRSSKVLFSRGIQSMNNPE
ncbi:hypothetical protein VNO77_27413 [Canavalia gladiata]|uniref:Uncharacterized protein n=1 Tax=Canavalia gladiata TaxID=3824 RepID=A0AAN9KVA4_CANGL